MRLRTGGVCSMVTSSTAVADADTAFGASDGASPILRFSEALLGEAIGIREVGVGTLLGPFLFTTNLFCFVASSSSDINVPVSRSVVGRAWLAIAGRVIELDNLKVGSDAESAAPSPSATNFK